MKLYISMMFIDVLLSVMFVTAFVKMYFFEMFVLLVVLFLAQVWIAYSAYQREITLLYFEKL